MAAMKARSMKTLLQTVVGLSFVTLLLLSTDAEAQTPKITSFKYNGNGCPIGTAVGEISLDGQVLTMKFSQFGVTTDQGALGKRRWCQLNIGMSYLPGYQFVLDVVTIRGYAYLEDKVKGVHKVSYYLTGLPGTGSFTETRYGDFDENYEISGPVRPVKWSVCNLKRNINVKTEVRVDNSANPTGSGLIDVDTKDVVVAFKLNWRSC